MTEDLRSVAEQFWEGRYRGHERMWSGRANPVLVDVAESLPAGIALDLGCGEGGDAIWLARLGWQVTAVDVSLTALERASTHSATAGVEARIDFQQHDLAHTLPTGAFDLVSAQYLHSPVGLPRDRVLQAAARTVAPGGLVLIVDHGSVRPWAWNQNPESDASRRARTPRARRPATRTRLLDADAQHRQPRDRGVFEQLGVDPAENNGRRLMSARRSAADESNASQRAAPHHEPEQASLF